MYKDHNRKYEHNNYNCYYTISKQSNIYIYIHYIITNIMASIASTTKDLKILIKQTFQLIDTDNNGTISKTELIRMFKNADVNAKKHIDGVFTRMDTDNDGHVDQAEFEAFMNEIHATFEIGEPGAP